MRNHIGTLRCWLFGHKFVGWSWEDGAIVKKAIDYCARCGISRTHLEQVKEEDSAP